MMKFNRKIRVIIMNLWMQLTFRHQARVTMQTKEDLKLVMVELESKWLQLMVFKKEKKSIVALERLQFKIGMKIKNLT